MGAQSTVETLFSGFQIQSGGRALVDPAEQTLSLRAIMSCSSFCSGGGVADGCPPSKYHVCASARGVAFD